MRYLCAVCLLVVASHRPCLAQQPAPATLENLLKSDEAQGAATVPEAEATIAAPKRPAGTVGRPKDGVQHPDLDKAWAEYDAIVTKAAANIRAAIAKQFDAATAKGDLDTAEKWQEIGDKFEKAGEVPAQPETKAAVSVALADYKKAKDDLVRAYDAVVKAMTMEKQLTDAKGVRQEKLSLEAVAKEDSPKAGPKDGEPMPDTAARKLLSQLLKMTEQQWLDQPGKVFTVRANADEPCETSMTVRQEDRFLLLPCPSDRWNSSPGRWGDNDFRGHLEDTKDVAKNGMPYLRLCYTIGDSPLIAIADKPIVERVAGQLRFAASDLAGGGGRGNNQGSVRVKVIRLK